MDKINVYHLNKNQQKLIQTSLRVAQIQGGISDADLKVMENLDQSIEICRDFALIIPQSSIDKFDKPILKKLIKGA